MFASLASLPNPELSRCLLSQHQIVPCFPLSLQIHRSAVVADFALLQNEISEATLNSEGILDHFKEQVTSLYVHKHPLFCFYVKM